MPSKLALCQIDGHAAAEHVIIVEVALDDITAEAKRDKKFLETVFRVVTHDVPEERIATDFDHGLRFHFRLFYEPGSKSAGEQHDLRHWRGALRLPFKTHLPVGSIRSTPSMRRASRPR